MMSADRKRQSLQTLLFIDAISCLFSLIFIYFGLTQYPQFLHVMMKSDLISSVWLGLSVVGILEGAVYEISPFTSALGKIVSLRKSFPEVRLSRGYGTIAFGLAGLLVWLDFKSAFPLFRYLSLAAFVAAFVLSVMDLKRVAGILKTV